MSILIRGAVLAFVLLLLGSGCGPSRPTRSPRDQAALVKFEDVRNAETEFFAKHRRYGTLAELIEFRPDAGAGMVDGEYSNHKFRVETGPRGYSLWADAVDGGDTGSSFYCDQTGVIKERRDGKPADANTPQAR
jgi:hypothetical protein